MTIRFPYSRQNITPEDTDAIVDAAKQPLLTNGPKLSAFETALRSKLGADHALVCNSGTAALHLVYLALGLSPDAGLVTTPLTFLATANAARMCNAPVIFADVDPVTGLITPDTLEAALKNAKSEVKVATIVHLGGRCADLPALAKVASKYGIHLVEDACHAIGAEYSENDTLHPIGKCEHSTAATFSFHPVKHITMGEGGAIMTNDSGLAEKIRLLRSHGVTRDQQEWTSPPEENAPWYYEMHNLGWNYRADEISCSLGLSQLARLDEGIARRRDLLKVYEKELSGIDGLSLPEEPLVSSAHAWHLYALSIDFGKFGKTRGQVMSELAKHGIGTQVHYIPITDQPYYQTELNTKTPEGAEYYYQRSLSIPLYPELTLKDATFISKTIKSCLLS